MERKEAKRSPNRQTIASGKTGSAKSMTSHTSRGHHSALVYPAPESLSPRILGAGEVGIPCSEEEGGKLCVGGGGGLGSLSAVRGTAVVLSTTSASTHSIQVLPAGKPISLASEDMTDITKGDPMPAKERHPSSCGIKSSVKSHVTLGTFGKEAEDNRDKQDERSDSVSVETKNQDVSARAKGQRSDCVSVKVSDQRGSAAVTVSESPAVRSQVRGPVADRPVHTDTMQTRGNHSPGSLCFHSNTGDCVAKGDKHVPDNSTVSVGEMKKQSKKDSSMSRDHFAYDMTNEDSSNSAKSETCQILGLRDSHFMGLGSKYGNMSVCQKSSSTDGESLCQQTDVHHFDRSCPQGSSQGSSVYNPQGNSTGRLQTHPSSHAERHSQSSQPGSQLPQHLTCSSSRPLSQGESVGVSSMGSVLRGSAVIGPQDHVITASTTPISSVREIPSTLVPVSRGISASLCETFYASPFKGLNTSPCRTASASAIGGISTSPGGTITASPKGGISCRKNNRDGGHALHVTFDMSACTKGKEYATCTVEDTFPTYPKRPPLPRFARDLSGLSSTAICQSSNLSPSGPRGPGWKLERHTRRSQSAGSRDVRCGTASASFSKNRSESLSPRLRNQRLPPQFFYDLDLDSDSDPCGLHEILSQGDLLSLLDGRSDRSLFGQTKTPASPLSLPTSTHSIIPSPSSSSSSPFSSPSQVSGNAPSPAPSPLSRRRSNGIFRSAVGIPALSAWKSIAHSYDLDICWFCGRPMLGLPSHTGDSSGIGGVGDGGGGGVPERGDGGCRQNSEVCVEGVQGSVGCRSAPSESSGEERQDRLAELERLLAQAHTDKLKLVEEQERLRHWEMAALSKERQRTEALERELRIVRLREKTIHQARPLTRFLPNTSEDLDLRRHLEQSGHHLESCPQVAVTSQSCRGFLHKMGGRIKTWRKRWFVVDRTKRKVEYYTDQTETRLKGEVSFQAIEDVYGDHLKTVKSPNPQLTFCLKTVNRTFFLVAATPESMSVWIDVLFAGAEGYRQFYS